MDSRLPVLLASPYVKELSSLQVSVIWSLYYPPLARQVSAEEGEE